MNIEQKLIIATTLLLTADSSFDGAFDRWEVIEEAIKAFGEDEARDRIAKVADELGIDDPSLEAEELLEMRHDA